MFLAVAGSSVADRATRVRAAIGRPRHNAAMLKRRGDYGYDAPNALIAFAAASTLFLIDALVTWTSGNNRPAPMPWIMSAFFLGNALIFFYTTRRGKFHVWSEILEGLRLRGDERVLDMGCG